MFVKNKAEKKFFLHFIMMFKGCTFVKNISEYLSSCNEKNTLLLCLFYNWSSISVHWALWTMVSSGAQGPPQTHSSYWPNSVLCCHRLKPLSPSFLTDCQPGKCSQVLESDVRSLTCGHLHLGKVKSLSHFQFLWLCSATSQRKLSAYTGLLCLGRDCLHNHLFLKAIALQDTT